MMWSNVASAIHIVPYELKKLNKGLFN